MDPTDVAVEVPEIKAEQKLKIFIGSWNVGNKIPSASSEDIRHWIPYKEGASEYDIIAIGLQECTYNSSKSDLSPKRRTSLFKGASEKCLDSSRSSLNNKAITSSLVKGPSLDRIPSVDDDKNLVAPSSPRHRLRDSIETLQSNVIHSTKSKLALLGVENSCPFLSQLKSHVGDAFNNNIITVELAEIRLIIFINSRNEYSQVEKATEATGVGSVLGNKGGTVASLIINDKTSLCFINCHLAAHEGQKFLDKRNQDIVDIMKGARVGNKLLDLDCQFHHVFWFGDMNYRIDRKLYDDKSTLVDDEWLYVHDLVTCKNWIRLNELDQLTHQIKNDTALSGWNLPPAHFAPTFKVNRHTNLEYMTKRIPSYCDRICYKSLPGSSRKITNTVFTSCEDLMTSDHKPVYGVFEIEPEEQRSVSATDTRMMAAQIILTDVRASKLLSMDISGSSDPYIIFITDPEELLESRDSESCAAAATSSDNDNHHIGKSSRSSSMLFQQCPYPSSTVKKRTLSPVWDNADIPVLELAIEDPMDLAGVHLFLVLQDHDATSKDDSMGQCALSLADLYNERKEAVPFVKELTLNGRPAGVLCGKIEFEFHEKARKEISSLRTAGCTCNIL